MKYNDFIEICFLLALALTFHLLLAYKTDFNLVYMCMS